MSPKHVPPPDLSGITSDWQKLADLRERSDKRPEQEEPAPGDATTSRPHDATPEAAARARTSTARRRGEPRGRRAAPRAADAVALTVRVDQQEANDIDAWLLELRAETGRRLDKAEVARELLRLGREHAGTRNALIRRLKP